MASMRECTAADFDQVLPLLAQLWPDKTLDPEAMQQVFQRGLASDFQGYFCAVEGDKVIGFISMTIVNNLWQQGYLGHIDEVVVDEAHRGNGIGAMMLDLIIEKIKARGCLGVELESAAHRKEAHKFYESLDFKNGGFYFTKRI